MKRQGTVAKIGRRGFVAILTEDDDFTILELLEDGQIELGDIIAWSDGHGLGRERYRNVSKGVDFKAYLQDYGVSRASLAHRMG